MLAPLNAYPAMAAPVDMSSEQLLGYWSSLLSGGRPFLVSDSAVPEGDLEGYEYWTKARRQAALKREQSLVMAFCRYLERNGRKFTSKTIRLESGTITCDVFDETRQILFEAKSSASDRAQLRMAIGQLYDYGYFGFDAPIRMAVLVPDKPAPDTVELLNHLGIGVAWQVSATMFEEVEP